MPLILFISFVVLVTVKKKKWSSEKALLVMRLKELETENNLLRQLMAEKDTRKETETGAGGGEGRAEGGGMEGGQVEGLVERRGDSREEGEEWREVA